MFLYTFENDMCSPIDWVCILDGVPSFKKKSLSPFSRSVDNVHYGIMSFDYKPTHKLQYYSSYVNSNVNAVRTTALHTATALAVRDSVKCVALGYSCVYLLTLRPFVWCHVTPPKLCLKYLSTSEIEWYYMMGLFTTKFWPVQNKLQIT